MGVRPGDRVGIYLRKSIDAVAAICGILKAGAAYVPVDPGAPPARNAYILHNCAVKAIVMEARFAAEAAERIRALGRASRDASSRLDRAMARRSAAHSTRRDAERPAPSTATVISAPGDLAYILYTSGSTGKPKGVMLSHENGVSFVDWCSEVFEPRPSDRFSSHAPFHFDLSILDIHVALKHGATLVLIGEDIGKDPERLAALIAGERISIWYSAPSILALLAQYGKLDRHDYSSAAASAVRRRGVRDQASALTDPAAARSRGTSTCTARPRPTSARSTRSCCRSRRTASRPARSARSARISQCKVVDPEGREVRTGEEGELCVSGRGVMQGYWALPEQTAKGFLTDAAGVRWYRTGDIVTEAPDGNYTYLGRRDRMVKRRGYRVELGEIEAALYQHPAIKEAAVIARPDEEAGVKITAFLSCRDPKRPSLIELKRFCSERLPLYMIPDAFSWHEALPKTSTDKTDYQRLKEMT